MKKQKYSINIFSVASLAILILMLCTTSTYAHRSPDNCSGSGLNINLYANNSQFNLGDTVTFSVTIFNGLNVGPIVCDATSIEASIVTPDGQTHPISLLRTSLTNGQTDSYSNVVSYTVRAQDVSADGILTATASDTGVIHQNDTDSQGGGNQGVNLTIIVPVLATLHVVKSVTNDSGGTATSADFTLHVKSGDQDVSGSPAVGVISPGTSYSLSAGTYSVSENKNTAYSQSFSGDCDSNGNISLIAGDDKTCTINNNDIARSSGGSSIVRESAFVQPVVVDDVPIILDVPVTPVVLAVSDVKFPNTGFAPNQNNAPWAASIFFGIFVLLTLMVGSNAHVVREE